MVIDDFQNWNVVKVSTEKKDLRLQFKEREVHFLRVGKNIGYENDGKGDFYVRPVVVLRKLTSETFIGIPLSTTRRRGSYYVPVSTDPLKKSVALLHQIRVFDAKRIERKMTMLSKADFENLQRCCKNIIDRNEKIPPPLDGGVVPKEKVPIVYKSTENLSKNHIVVLAHNIRSLWNVGSLFRSCDCFAVQKLYLTGYTATPPRREITKTAIGAEEYVPWEYSKDPFEVIQTLKDDGYQIIALEHTSESIDIVTFTPQQKMCLILGHEVTGVSKELLETADAVVHIAMHGQKESLNVSNATGIALHHFRNLST